MSSPIKKSNQTEANPIASIRLLSLIVMRCPIFAFGGS